MWNHNEWTRSATQGAERLHLLNKCEHVRKQAVEGFWFGNVSLRSVTAELRTFYDNIYFNSVIQGILVILLSIKVELVISALI